MPQTQALARRQAAALPAAAAEMSGFDLRRMARAVLPHTAADEEVRRMLPELCAVQWEIRDGALWLAATDRYTLAVARWPVSPGAGPAAALVPVPETAALARLATARPRAGITVTVSGDGVGVAVSGGRKRCRPRPARYHAAALTGPETDAKPDWRAVLAAWLDGASASLDDRLSWNSAYLARFRVLWDQVGDISGWPGMLQARVCHPAGSTTTTGLLVTCEDWFIGVMLPAGLSPDSVGEVQHRRDAWRAWLHEDGTP